jgi:hypothetical protein
MKHLALLTVALFACLGVSATASPFSDAAAQLDGEWRAADFVLRVDAPRAQASLEQGQPFAWERFVIKEVTPSEVVFAVGAELYEARIDTDILTLTGTSFRGTRVLFRETGGLRGTAE